MREENVKLFVQGFYDADCILYDLNEKRMIEISLKDEDGMRNLTTHLKDVRDLMDIDLDNLKVTMDRDNFESIMFTAAILSRANDLFGGLENDSTNKSR